MRKIGRKLREDKIWSRRIFLILLDILVISLSGALALLTRFEFIWSDIDQSFVDAFVCYLPMHLVITLGIFWAFRLYHSLWKYANLNEIVTICFACALAEIADFMVIRGMKGYLPRSYYLLNVMYTSFGISLVRFSYRCVRMMRRRLREEGNVKNVMVVGAGAAGTMIIKEMIDSRYLHCKVKCIIDDDRAKRGCYIHGIRVVGGRDMILNSAKKYQIRQIIIAMPSQSQRTIREILDICKETDCELKTLPGMYQLVNDEVQVKHLRDVDINDLLARDTVVIDDVSISGYIAGKIVLVTGGGGSIGSELCRQIAAREPKQLVIVDIYENNAYDIQQELISRYPKLDLKVLIGSVRNTKRMDDIMGTYRPDVVYHAAAHKHVPLMEISPDEAIKNNVLGTLKTVQAADKWGVERFVLISTDKAVNPTNIMGASKRLCEMIIQMYDRRSETEFVAVRFGNVLGSNGSVIPLFRRQIVNGGPVTVTHPDVIRYFMTIPEAVSLVLQAGMYAKGGEIFVLDMGEPVRILDLAKNLIRLSGLKEGEDIEIVFTGLRPGEKLYEELLMDEEGLRETENKLIYIGKPIEFDEEWFEQELKNLRRAAEGEAKDIREMVRRMVPTYQSDNADR